MALLGWIVLGWVFMSCAATFAWCGFVEVCRWQQRRRELAFGRLPAARRQRGTRSVGDLAERALPLAAHTCQVRARDEGTAPVDRAPLPVPSGDPTLKIVH